MTILLRKTAQHSLLVLAFCLLDTNAFAADWQYTVRPGDSIWTICGEYTSHHNCWRELPVYNRLDNPEKLSVGEQLKIPAIWLKQAPAAATVIFVQGEVLLGALGQQKRLNAPQKLKIGDTVETREGSATLQFVDGSILSMSSNSIIRLDAVSAFRQTKSTSINVSLPRGELGIRVPPREPKTRFNVRTPSAIAAVRGTKFRVNSDAELQATRSEVLEGQVALGAEGREVELGAGFGALAERGRELSEPVQLLNAPEWNLSCTDPGYAEWQELPDASYYKLQLLEDNPAIDKLIATKNVSKSNYTFKNLEEKCYQLKVSAVDAQGFNGMESQRQFCYELQLDTPVIETANWTNNVLNVNWGAVQYAEAYKLQVSRDPEFTEIVYSETVSAEQLSQPLKGFSGKAHVRVLSASGDYQSGFSEPVAFKHETQRFWLVGILAAIAAFAIL